MGLHGAGIPLDKGKRTRARNYSRSQIMPHALQRVCAMIETSVVRRQMLSLLIGAAMLGACSVQLVSPYSADLQRRASDMVAEVSAWDLHMQNISGTVGSDPRHSDVQTALQNWQGEVDAMTGIALGLDPGIVRCDEVAGRVAAGIRPLLPKSMTAGLPPAGAAPSIHSAKAQGCEVFVFNQINNDLATLQQLLDRQCRLPWLSDEYFTTLTENKAAQTVSRPPRPATMQAGSARSKTPNGPTSDEQALARARCGALFGGGGIAQNGPAVSNLVHDLQAIVYIESRKKPSTGG